MVYVDPSPDCSWSRSSMWPKLGTKERYGEGQGVLPREPIGATSLAISGVLGSDRRRPGGGIMMLAMAAVKAL